MKKNKNVLDFVVSLTDKQFLFLKSTILLLVALITIFTVFTSNIKNIDQNAIKTNVSKINESSLNINLYSEQFLLSNQDIADEINNLCYKNSSHTLIGNANCANALKATNSLNKLLFVFNFIKLGDVFNMILLIIVIMSALKLIKEMDYIRLINNTRLSGNLWHSFDKDFFNKFYKDFSHKEENIDVEVIIEEKNKPK